MQITEKKTPIIPEKDLMVSSQFTENRRIKNNLDILQTIKCINIQDNVTSNEIYKNI